jgi:hypothetical protein
MQSRQGCRIASGAGAKRRLGMFLGMNSLPAVFRKVREL